MEINLSKVIGYWRQRRTREKNFRKRSIIRMKRLQCLIDRYKEVIEDVGIIIRDYDSLVDCLHSTQQALTKSEREREALEVKAEDLERHLAWICYEAAEKKKQKGQGND